ncbi:FAD-binding protein [Desulfitobacterium sp. AusDCA]|uniref:FAD-binding protein n=1 Tax=Desulfitobacterium sp. AusDCA TaxID=3240383 RepID=UPI003DA743ED
MWDGIIIGSGLSGLIAGIRAVDNGKRVLMISEGISSLGSAAGVFNFGDLAQLQGKLKHPYSLFDKMTIRQGFDYFLNLCPQYIGEWGRTNTVLTPLGTERKAELVPRRFRADLLESAKRLILIAPQGLKDFFPEVIKGNLQKNFPYGEVLIKPIQVDKFKPWYELGKSILGNNYAKFWCTEDGVASLQKIFQEISDNIDKGAGQSAEETVVIFPSIAAEFYKPLEDMFVQAPFSVIELMAFPPSTMGLTLYDALKRKFQSMGGEMLRNSRVSRCELEQGECRSVVVNSRGKEVSFAAKTFVIASGGILGGGIQGTPQGVREMVADLPLFIPQTLTGAEFLDHQPYALIGAEVNSELRPIDPATGAVLFNNVMVVGRMLGHWDPWQDGCGGGVSITSGYFAGTKI